MEWWKNVSLTGRFTVLLATALVFLIALFLFFDYQRQHNLATKLAAQNARFLSGIVLEQLQNSSIEQFPQMGTPSCYNPSEFQQQMIRATGNRKVAVRIISLDSTKSIYTPDVFETEKLHAIKSSRADTCDILSTGREKSIIYVKPLLANGKCIGCHGAFENVSEKMRQYFPPANRIYGHKNDEVMGALVLSLPVRSLDAAIWRNVWKQSMSLFLGGGLLLILVNILLRFMVLKPLQGLTKEGCYAVTGDPPTSYPPEIAAIFVARRGPEEGPRRNGAHGDNVPCEKEKGAA